MLVPQGNKTDAQMPTGPRFATEALSHVIDAVRAPARDQSR